MNRDDWQAVIDKAGSQRKAAAAIGLDEDIVSAYAHGKRPTPRKVALACAAYMRGIKPMGSE